MVVTLKEKNDDGDDEPTVVSASFLPIDLGDVVLKKHSPSGKNVVYLRATSDDKGTKRFVEVSKLSGKFILHVIYNLMRLLRIKLIFFKDLGKEKFGAHP